MDLISLILLSIGLGMDCFSVSTTCGIVQKKTNFLNVLKMALAFGIFQAFMPLIGFFLSVNFSKEIEFCDHWIAFGILLFIGGKMIIESFKEEQENDIPKDYFNYKSILILAVATSIDALATGIIFIQNPECIWLAISIIGIGSFLMSIGGFFLGKFVGNHIPFKFEIVGGIILIGIGIKILIEHLLM